MNKDIIILVFCAIFSLLGVGLAIAKPRSRQYWVDPKEDKD